MSYILLLIGLILFIFPGYRWYKLTKQVRIDDELLSKRKTYKQLSSIGIIITFVLLARLLSELAGNGVYLAVFISIFYDMKLFFEPYYPSSVVGKIENFCLYLRPFSIDGKDNIRLGETIEKNLCRKLEDKVSQVFCVGNPNSCLPTTLSSSCIYASDSKWKGVVHELYSRAYYTIIHIARTDGCIWELNYCFENEYLYKTIFVLKDDEGIEILRENATNIDLPEDLVIHPGKYAVIYKSSTNGWIIKEIQTMKSIDNVIDEIVNSNTMYSIEKKNYVRSVFHVLAFFLSPYTCIKLNRWSCTSQLAYYLSIIASLALAISLNISRGTDDYILLDFIPVIFTHFIWSFFSGKISWNSKHWGGQYVFTETHKELCKWFSIVYLLIILILLLNV